MTTQEKNKLIAEFMGLSCFQNAYDMYSSSEFNHLFEDIESDDADAKHYYYVSEFKFHSSWDWLMTVVRQIYDIGLSGGILYEMREALACADIDASYDAIVKFIEWYNKRKSN